MIIPLYYLRKIINFATKTSNTRTIKTSNTHTTKTSNTNTGLILKGSDKKEGLPVGSPSSYLLLQSVAEDELVVFDVDDDRMLLHLQTLFRS